MILSWDLVPFFLFSFFLLPLLPSSVAQSEGPAWRKRGRSHLVSLRLWTHPPSYPLCPFTPLSSLALCDHLRQTLTVFFCLSPERLQGPEWANKKGLFQCLTLSQSSKKNRGKGRQSGLAGPAAMLKKPSPSRSSTVQCRPLPNAGQWALPLASGHLA